MAEQATSSTEPPGPTVSSSGSVAATSTSTPSSTPSSTTTSSSSSATGSNNSEEPVGSSGSGAGSGTSSGPAWWAPTTQPWKPYQTAVTGARNTEHGKNISVTTINVPQTHEMNDASGKSVCKYLGGENGVTVSVVSNCGPDSTVGSQDTLLSHHHSHYQNQQQPHHHHHHHHNHPHHHQQQQQQQQQSYSQEDLDDSDGEVSRIDFRGVNLRTKKKRDGASWYQDSDHGNDSMSGDNAHQQPERPMSWEGELSDQEMSSNTLTGQDTDEMVSMECSSTSPRPQEQKYTPIKPEPDQFPSSQALTTIGVGLNETVVAVSHPNNAHSFASQQQQPQQQRGLENNNNEQNQQTDLPLLVGKLLGGCNNTTPNHSPVLIPRHHLSKHSHTRSQVPSPDSAVHSAYSVFSSPTQSPHAVRHSALGPGSPVPSSSVSLSRNSFNNSTSSLSLSHSLSRNNSDASSSCYSYGSISPPNHSPIQQPRHPHHHTQQHHQVPAQGSPLHISGNSSGSHYAEISGDGHLDDQDDCRMPTTPAGISTRQQLINSPCPICGDKISGFHYGIFSCESCKGFFKRTVQNRKNYVCLRGAGCPVTVATRKKCPACRFDKCLNMGMKLEAIREDRTRGGRSTYQCTYTLPPSIIGNSAGLGGEKLSSGPCSPVPSGSEMHHTMKHQHANHSHKMQVVPQLLQDIMDVEHLWHYDNNRQGDSSSLHRNSNRNGEIRNHLGTSNGASNPENETLETPSESGNNNAENSGSSQERRHTESPNLSNQNSIPHNPSKNTFQNPDCLSNLCSIADHRLYKIVKWCKSLPLFKNISIDDQICLLINSWCELLLFSCCFRSMSTPGEIRVSLGKSITLEQAKQLGLATCIERMLAFTNNLRRLRVDQYEYVAMKVIVLLTSDTSELKEPEKVRASQEKALQALQQYTVSRYPEMPAKFGELLLRIPDLQRTCQAGKELLSAKRAEGDGSSFNLLMELLRGDH